MDGLAEPTASGLKRKDWIGVRIYVLESTYHHQLSEAVSEILTGNNFVLC